MTRSVPDLIKHIKSYKSQFFSPGAAMTPRNSCFLMVHVSITHTKWSIYQSIVVIRRDPRSPWEEVAHFRRTPASDAEKSQNQ